MIGSDAAPPTRGPNGFPYRGGSDGILAVGWGSGVTDFTYLISPIEAIQGRARKDGTAIDWHFDDFGLADAQSVALGTDAALVFIKANSGEGFLIVDGNVCDTNPCIYVNLRLKSVPLRLQDGDRNNLTAWANGDNLVNAVASVHKNTIVVVNSVGPLNVELWIDHPNVTAVSSWTLNSSSWGSITLTRYSLAP